ncbi:unnamed protein product [Lactuca virosa]|uniref:Uncharacterized protein n=1 Tax=Lactuca virosa TaxID=75947 RepID=A0AAU9M497_9ASTR|nr:unnamed protein product [Lactuca virosa]
MPLQPINHYRKRQRSQFLHLLPPIGATPSISIANRPPLIYDLTELRRKSPFQRRDTQSSPTANTRSKARFVKHLQGTREVCIADQSLKVSFSGHRNLTLPDVGCGPRPPNSRDRCWFPRESFRNFSVPHPALAAGLTPLTGACAVSSMAESRLCVGC